MGKILKNKKLVYLIIVLIISVVSAAFGLDNYDKFFDGEPFVGTQVNEVEPTKYMNVHYIDVGQGDCSLIVCDGKTMLIDAGENGNETKVLDYLRKQNIDRLDYIIASHQHSDHIGGLPEVLDEPLALLIAVEMIPDLVRTVGNVTMDVAATTAIARMGPASDAVSEGADGYGGGEDDASPRPAPSFVGAQDV